MKLLFFTRLAIKATLLHGHYRLRTDEEIAAIVELWIEKSSRFYAEQTVDLPFEVILLYSDCYVNVLNSFEFPSYATLTTQTAEEWAADNRNVPLGSQVAISRVDADDSYSVDFFEYLKQATRRARRLLLHKQIRQYDTQSRWLTEVLHHPSPMFATVLHGSWPGCTVGAKHLVDNPLYGVVGNHGGYADHPHLTSPDCFALMRITGRNATTQFGTIGHTQMNPKCTKTLDPRFVGY